MFNIGYLPLALSSVLQFYVLIIKPMNPLPAPHPRTMTAATVIEFPAVPFPPPPSLQSSPTAAATAAVSVVSAIIRIVRTRCNCTPNDRKLFFIALSRLSTSIYLYCRSVITYYLYFSVINTSKNIRSYIPLLYNNIIRVILYTVARITYCNLSSFYIPINALAAHCSQPPAFIRPLSPRPQFHITRLRGGTHCTRGKRFVAFEIR